MLRLVALMNTHSHIMMDAQTSPYRRSEIPLAQSMMTKIPDNSITLFDKGFWGENLMFGLSQSGRNRHWLIPARNKLVYEMIDNYGHGDPLWKMKVSPQARKKNPNLTEYWQARAVTYEINGKAKTALTTLPANKYSAEKIAELYHQHWEIELGFRDIKSSIQANAMTLRSKKVELIYQKIWGMLLAYNVIRREASLAAIEHKQRACDIRFKMAYQYIASQLIVMSKAVPVSKTSMRLKELWSGITNLFLDRSPSRPSRPRRVKMSKTQYPVNKRAVPLSGQHCLGRGISYDQIHPHPHPPQPPALNT